MTKLMYIQFSQSKEAESKMTACFFFFLLIFFGFRFEIKNGPRTTINITNYLSNSAYRFMIFVLYLVRLL